MSINNEQNTSTSTSTASTLGRVCCFKTITLDSGWQSSMGTENFGVDLLVNQHGLYDLINAVRQFGKENNQLFFGAMDSEQPYYGVVKFDGVQYYISPTNPIPLSSLELQNGQKGSYDGGILGTFTFTLDNCNVPLDDTNNATRATTDFPRKLDFSITTQRDLSTRCDSSHLTNNDILLAQQIRYDYVDYMDFVNKYRLHTEYCMISRQSPGWTFEEDYVIGMFMSCGWKPKKTWDNCLQYTFLNRTYSAFSQRWHKCKRDNLQFRNTSRYEPGPDQDNAIKKAKRYCLNIMEREFVKGGPYFENNLDDIAFREFKQSRYVQE